MPSLEELRRWLRGEEVEGLGRYEDEEPEPKAVLGDNYTLCTECRGSGERDERVCEVCDGVGKVTKKAKTFPEGMSKVAARAKRSGRYEVVSHGTDARLLFGKHTGALVSSLSVHNRDYLQWLLKEGFPPELKEIIKRYVPEPKMTVQEDLKSKTKNQLVRMGAKYGLELDSAEMSKADMIVRIMVAIKKAKR